MTISVCIFAYNEERLLPRCVGALDAAAEGAPYRAHIMVNGSTDETLAVANTLAAADARLSVHELPVGDKANAWNEYVHRIAGGEDAHIFIDGDVMPSTGAIASLARALSDDADAMAAAALPASGRSRRSWSERLFMNRYLTGNLYALSDAALDAFRQRKLRLPFGAKGEDGLISYLLLTDLEGGEDDTHLKRIVIAEDATFEFESLGMNIRDLRIYHRRLKRYSERHYQKEILYRILKQQGVAAMPDRIYDIYTPDALDHVRPRLDFINYFYDRTTLARLRQSAIPSMRS